MTNDKEIFPARRIKLRIPVCQALEPAIFKTTQQNDEKILLRPTSINRNPATIQ